MIEAMLMGGGMGANIKSIQTINFAGSEDRVVDFSIDTIDPSKTLILSSQAAWDSSSHDGRVYIYLSSDNQVTAESFFVGNVYPFHCFVIEFSGGVTVQRGISTIDAASLTIPIDAIDQSKSFVITDNSLNNADPSRCMTKCSFSSDTSILIERPNRGFSSMRVAWQVVELK